MKTFSAIAQQTERVLYKGLVAGLNPACATTIFPVPVLADRQSRRMLEIRLKADSRREARCSIYPVGCDTDQASARLASGCVRSIAAGQFTFATGGVVARCSAHTTETPIELPCEVGSRACCDSIYELTKSRCVRSNSTRQPQRTISSAFKKPTCEISQSSGDRLGRALAERTELLSASTCRTSGRSRKNRHALANYPKQAGLPQPYTTDRELRMEKRVSYVAAEIRGLRVVRRFHDAPSKTAIGVRGISAAAHSLSSAWLTVAGDTRDTADRDIRVCNPRMARSNLEAFATTAGSNPAALTTLATQAAQPALPAELTSAETRTGPPMQVTRPTF